MKAFDRWNEEMYVKHGNLNRIRSANPFIKWFTNQRAKTISEMIDINPSDSLLDLGCGAGFITKRILDDLYPRECNVLNTSDNTTLVDLSETALHEAREVLKHYSGIVYVHSNAETYKSDNKFNAIVCTEVLEHTQHPDKVIDVIASTADKDTCIIISVPNEKLTNAIKKSAFGLLGKPLDDWHIHEFDKEKIINLTKNKFKLIDEKAIPNKKMPLTYILKFKLRE